MPNLPFWNLSPFSRDRIGELLTSAAELGIDPDAIAEGGLAALQSLIALKRAKDAAEGTALIRHDMPIFFSRLRRASSL